jgi:hypothetical protein
MEAGTLDAYYDESNLNYDEVPTSLPAWSAFVLGGIITFLLVYVGVARPLARELSSLRSQVSALTNSVDEVTSNAETAGEAASVLSSLAQQENALDGARSSIAQMQELQRQLLAEARQTQDAMSAVAALGALKDTLLANADRAEEAASVMSTSELICQRLAESAESTYDALEAGNNLLSLREELVARGRKAESASLVLDSLIEIQDTLDRENDGFQVARDRIADLLNLKDAIVDQTDDLADAISTLQATSDLSAQFNQAISAFEQIRRWMIEVVATQPLLERARFALEPITELGNLRHVGPERLREIAKSVTEQYQRTRVASKPTELDAIEVPFGDIDTLLGGTEMLDPISAE